MHRKALLVGRIGKSVLGPSVNQRIVDAVTRGLQDVELQARPIAHGWGSVVYLTTGSTDTPRRCIKVVNPRIGLPGGEAAKAYAADIDLHTRFLGESAADTKVDTIDSPFARDQQLVVVQQEQVIGTPLLPYNPAADTESLKQFGGRVRDMLTATGCLPDIGGPGNILVERSGRLKLVDVGAPIPPDRSDFCSNLVVLHGLESGTLFSEIAA